VYFFYTAAISVAILTIAGCNQPNRGTSSAGSDGARATQAREFQATWSYWTSLRQITILTNASFGEAKGADGFSTAILALRNRAKSCQKASTEIHKLGVLHVLSEVVDHAARVSLVDQEVASLSSDVADWMLEVKALSKHAGSLEVGLDAFIRGFLGDPLATANELKGQARELESRRLALFQRWKAVEAKTRELESGELSLRSKLSSRYTQEFPRLSP